MSETNPYVPPRARVVAEESAPERGEPAHPVAWFFAGFLDIVIAYVVGGVATIPVAVAMESLVPGVLRAEGEGLMAFGRAFMIAGGAVFLLYCPLLESSALQATFGKWLFSVRLATAEGRRLTFGRALGRHLAHVGLMLATLVGFPLLPLILIVVNGGLLAWGPRYQTLHDRLSGVRLVRVRRRQPIAAA